MLGYNNTVRYTLAAVIMKVYTDAFWVHLGEAITEANRSAENSRPAGATYKSLCRHPNAVNVDVSVIGDPLKREITTEIRDDRS